MATYDLTRTQLDAALTHNFDAQTRAAIIDYLNDAHAFDPKVTVDNEPFPANSSADANGSTTKPADSSSIVRESRTASSSSTT